MTKLTALKTTGVAVVTAGANGKRIALAKGQNGEDITFEELALAIIEKGDMPLDEKAIEDLCLGAGLDAQATETMKAILKLSHVYRDNAAFKGLLKQQFSMQKPAAAPGQPGQQPGMQAPTGPQAQGQPQPAGVQQQQAADASAEANANAEAPGAEEGAEKPAPPFGKKPGAEKEEAPSEESEGAKPPFAAKQEAPSDEDENTEEPPMDPKKEQELKKAADDAVAKADAAQAEIVALKKSNEDMKAAMTGAAEAAKAQVAIVKKMQDDARMGVWVAKCEKHLAHIPGETAETLAKKLFDIETASAELAVSTFDAFKKTAEIVKASGMFQPVGSAGGAPVAGTATAEIEKRLGELVKKGVEKGETVEVAEARAMSEIVKSDPALYGRYSREQMARAKAANAN